MPESRLRLVRRSAEYRPQDEIGQVPPTTRDIYVLYKQRRKKNQPRCYEVVYIGMARENVRARLQLHRRRKRELWTHFSVFSVWDNIRNEEIAELEGVFRHVYRDDPRASRLNVQRGFRPLRKLRNNALSEWPRTAD